MNMLLQIRSRLKAIKPDRNAVLIAAVYLFIGGLWVLLTDRFAEAISKNTQTLTTISTYKGWFYVLVTGLLLYWLIHRNNSSLQRDNEQLRTANEDYQEIFDYGPVGIYRSTPDGHLLTVNQKLASMFGYDSPEQMLTSISDIGNQIYKDSARRAGYQKTITGQGFINEFVNEERRKDGSWIWTSTTARVVKDDAGHILYYEGFTIDVTERIRGEQALANAEYKYRSLVEEIPVVIYVASLDHKSIYVSPQIEKFIGFSPEEWLADPELWVKRLHPKDRQRVLEENTNALTDREKYSAEYRMIARDGRTIWIHDEGRILSTSYDLQKQIQGIWQNITERKQIEENLMESEEKFRQAVQTSPDSININRLEDGMYVSINKGFTQIMGYSENDVCGKTSHDLQIWENPEDRIKLVGELRKSGQINNLEAPFRTKSGDVIYGSMSAAVIKS